MLVELLRTLQVLPHQGFRLGVLERLVDFRLVAELVWGSPRNDIAIKVMWHLP